MRRSATFSVIWVCSFCSPTVAFAEGEPGDGELAAIRAAFATRAIGDSEAELVALVERRPESEAGERARLWLGDLALQAKRYDDADARYEAARRHAPPGDLRALALRGLGCVAAQRHHWNEAASWFDQALVDAPPTLAYELHQRTANAKREHRRFLLAIAAGALLFVVAIAFALRLRNRPRDLFPLVTRFMLPVQALLCAAAWGRDPAVFRTLVEFAIGSLVLSWLAFATRGRRPLADLVAMIAATCACAYVAVWHAGLLDVLRETMQAGAGSG